MHLYQQLLFITWIEHYYVNSSDQNSTASQATDLLMHVRKSIFLYNALNAVDFAIKYAMPRGFFFGGGVQ